MFTLFKPVLNLFDGDGGAAAEGTTTNQESTVKGDNEVKYESTRHTKKDNVVYGKQETTNVNQANDEVSVETTNSNTLEDRRKAFKNLIDSEYKDIYTEETQRIIDRRFKETKQLQSQINETQPLIDMLKNKYGVEDIKSVMMALEDDDNYWQDQADEAGMTIEQFKQYQKLKVENEQFKKFQEEQQKQNDVKERANQWFPEIENIQSKYPGFELANELQDQKFVNLLNKLTDAQFPEPLKTAYELMHKDEIAELNRQAQEKAVVDNIRARGSRPSENGTSSQSAFIVKDDVSKLSKEDRRNIAKRVMMGEKITF